MTFRVADSKRLRLKLRAERGCREWNKLIPGGKIKEKKRKRTRKKMNEC